MGKEVGRAKGGGGGGYISDPAKFTKNAKEKTMGSEGPAGRQGKKRIIRNEGEKETLRAQNQG
jgi:hypothetical protein